MRLRTFLCLEAIVSVSILSARHQCSGAETNQPNVAPQRSQAGPAIVRPTEWAVKLNKPGLPNLCQVTTNLYRGAQPTAAGMAELKAMGVKTVINLRSYHSDKDELAKAGSELKQGRFHMKAWHGEDEDIIRFLKIVSDTNNLPVFVHCQYGADRTGLVCAMYRIALCGWTKQEAIKEMKEGEFGFHRTAKSLVKYLERADIDEIKHLAGIANKPATSESPTKSKKRRLDRLAPK